MSIKDIFYIPHYSINCTTKKKYSDRIKEKGFIVFYVMSYGTIILAFKTQIANPIVELICPNAIKMTIVINVVGLPNDLLVYWEQYPWMFGEALCKIRALISEM